MHTMQRMRWLVVVALALMVAACGNNQITGNPTPTPTAQPTATVPR